MDSDSSKMLELDKICRVCLLAKKDMRPLHGEMISEMLMEFSGIQVRMSCSGKRSVSKDKANDLWCFVFCWQIDQADGWPDKICVQCVHQVSRCHSFKCRVEKSDEELRHYIKGITVIVEPITQIELQAHPQIREVVTVSGIHDADANIER